MTEFMDRQIMLQRAGQKEYTEEEVRLIINGAIQEEREACAEICEQAGDTFTAKVIRMRNNSEDIYPA